MIAAASRSSAGRPASALAARCRLTMPAPERTRSADTWPSSSRSQSRTRASPASAAASVAWPPSPTTGTGPAGVLSRPETPRPVPGPSSAIGSPSRTPPPPTGRNSSARAVGNAMREGGEVIEDEQTFDAPTALQSGDREAPWPIGHRNLVAEDRRGDADRGRRAAAAGVARRDSGRRRLRCRRTRRWRSRRCGRSPPLAPRPRPGARAFRRRRPAGADAGAAAPEAARSVIPACPRAATGGPRR